MTQVIQIKRRIGGAPGGPTAGSLQAGELAYNNADNALYVGGDVGGTTVPLVHNLRQLEIHAASPAQSVLGGAKTFTVGTVALPGGTLKITGGAAGQALTTDGAGNLAFAPVVAASQQLIGSLDATAGNVTLTAQAGGGAVLPAAGTANGWYVIADVAGTVAAANPAGIPAGVYQIGDWVISNGTAWNHLEFGGINSVTAADVGVVAPVTGGSNVQDVLESMQTDAAEYVSGPATSTAGFIATYADATGKLIATGIDPATLATVGYVNTENTAQDDAQVITDDAQDVLITANAAAITALQTANTAQDTEIDTKITKPASVLAIGNIATYADIGGAAALDGGMSIADITDLIDLKQDAATAGDVKGPASAAADGNIAVFNLLTGKIIKDGGTTIAAIQAAAGDVKGPALAVINSNLTAFDTTTGKLIKDAGTSVATLQADIAARGDVKGPAAVVIPNNLAAFDTNTGKLIKDSGQSITSIQTYVDTAINNIPGATPPDVFEPDLTGDGTAATPITWTGVKFVVPTPPELSPFTGLGTTASPLALVGIDGGVF